MAWLSPSLLQPEGVDLVPSSPQQPGHYLYNPHLERASAAAAGRRPGSSSSIPPTTGGCSGSLHPYRDQASSRAPCARPSRAAGAATCIASSPHTNSYYYYCTSTLAPCCSQCGQLSVFPRSGATSSTPVAASSLTHLDLHAQHGAARLRTPLKLLEQAGRTARYSYTSHLAARRHPKEDLCSVDSNQHRDCTALI